MISIIIPMYNAENTIIQTLKEVAFTDADCILQRDWLENLVNEFNENIVGIRGAVI